MEVAVFGASGFVGRNLVEELTAAGHAVVACDVEKTSFEAPAVTNRHVYITEPSAGEEAVHGADTVAHLAAHQLPESMDEPRLNAEVNVVGSLAVLNASRAAGVDKVFFSSASSVVGEVDTVPVPEDHPVTPQSHYGVAKHAVEEYLRVYQDLYDLDYLAFRFFNVYGPYQRPESCALVPVVLSRLHDGEGDFVTGDEQQTRDFVYVGDLVEYVRRGLEGDVRNELVNMGTGVDTPTLQAIETMADVIGVDPDIERRPERPDEIDDFYADTTKCRRLFGDAPSTGFRAGVEDTYEWIRQLD